MAQPNPYVRQFNFTNYSTLYPSLPQPGVNLDVEFSSVKATLDQTLVNLKLIQRDDGALANLSVGIDQLKAEVTTGMNPPVPWVTGTNYVVNSFVSVNSAQIYRCLVAHTSGVFNTDLVAGKWVLLVDMSTALATTGAFFSGVFTGNGATTAYNLGFTIGSNERVVWVENGAVKIPGVDYTVSGTTLTRTVAPGNGVAISWRLLGSITTYAVATASVGTAAIVDGSVTNAKLASGAVDSGKLANNAVSNAKMATMPASTLKANLTAGAAVPTDPTLTQMLDALAGSTLGSIMMRDPTLGWIALAPPSAAGYVLTGNGLGAAPYWGLANATQFPFPTINLR